MSALLYILALSGLWTVLVLGVVVVFIVSAAAEIYTLRSDDGWEARPPPRDDMDMDDIE